MVGIFDPLFVHEASLCAIASTNCKTYKQIFKNAGVHLKTKTSSYSVPA